MTQGPGPQDPQNPYGQPSHGHPGQQPGGVPPQPGAGQTPPPPPPPPGQGGGYGQQVPPPPPPPQGGYSQTPPPPPPPAGGAGDDGPALNSVKKGFAVFKDNAATLIIGSAIWIVGVAVVMFILNVAIFQPLFVRSLTTEQILSGRGGSMGGLLGGSLLMGIVVALVGVVLALLAYNGMLNALIKAHDTGKVEISDFFTFRNIPQVIIFALVVGVASGITQITVILPVAIGLFTMFSLLLIIDRNQSFWDAIMNSAKLVAANFGQTILLYVLCGLIVLAGAILCGIGVIVAGPIAGLAMVSFYRTLGEAPQEFKFS